MPIKSPFDESKEEDLIAVYWVEVVGVFCQCLSILVPLIYSDSVFMVGSNTQYIGTLAPVNMEFNKPAFEYPHCVILTASEEDLKPPISVKRHCLC